MSKSPFSLKGLGIGTLLCLAIGVVAPYAAVFSYHRIGFNPSSPGALFFFACVLFANVAVAFLGRRLALSKPDLVLIYCMLLMAVTVPTWGLMFFLIGTLVYPFYFATPENRFEDLFFDYIPQWMAPRDPEAIKGYYEGLPKGTPIPWEVWVEPMAWWLGLVVVMGFMLICLSGILHRQWSAHERLAYPMMQLPQGMLAGEEGGVSRVAPLFRNPVMWVGFSLPFVYLTMKGLNFHFPFLPDPDLDSDPWVLRGSVYLPVRVVFAYIGFFYLASLDLTFSVWFFFLFYKVQEGAFNVFGVASAERLSGYEWPPIADLVHQQTGAAVVFILFGLWSARAHLRDVMRAAWNPGNGVDDSDELLRYRTAVAGFLASFAAIGFWLWRSGVPALYVPVLLVFSIVFFVLVARVVATAGVPTTRSPIVPAYFVISGFGTSMLGTKGLVALTFTFIWQGESRTSPMVAACNGLKLAESVKGSKTRLFWGLMIALAASLLASLWTTLELAYTNGAVNLPLLQLAGGHCWPQIGGTANAMPEANLRGWLFRGIGGGFEFLLMWGQHRWHWWPLHPIGFAVAFGWLTSSVWFSALIAWVLKAIILHVGGGKLFRTLRPFFLGLILGEVLTAGAWVAVYSLTVEYGRVLSIM